MQSRIPTLLTGVILCFSKEKPFQMQSTNATLFAGILLCGYLKHEITPVNNVAFVLYIWKK
jgi:hypothetical protein